MSLQQQTSAKADPLPFKVSSRNSDIRSENYMTTQGGICITEKMASLPSRSQRTDNVDVEEFDPLNVREDSEGWNDVEEDQEEISIVCLLCKQTFTTLQKVVTHSKEQHDLDLLQVREKHGLDFYSLIKFVNYVRSEVHQGNSKPDTDDPQRWQDDSFLQPFMENDALLFSLDELDDIAGGSTAQSESDQGKKSMTDSAQVADLEAKLADLQSQFEMYRDQVGKTLDQRWTETEGKNESWQVSKLERYDESYFESYSYNDIHQTMLQDTVRTDAYRDFVYDNKHLFEGKVVMDVGCGTGILSMFCAKAGAKQVFAIDNSAIIDKARQIAEANGMLDRITFVRGKAEELDELPGGVKEVDIIISEWMGYCLYFEAMLPSVLKARDRFLKRNADGSFKGLMAPSHCSILMAPLTDPDWVEDNVTYWKDVYGFDMNSMLEGALEDVVVRQPRAETVAGAAVSGKPIKVWDLHKTKVEDLQFSAPFKVKLDKEIDCLDAWCIWFDITFSPSVDVPGSEDGYDIDVVAKQPGAVTFSTGPQVKATHWQCGICVIERKDNPGKQLQVGDVVEGTLKYATGEESRALAINISWADQKGQESGEQRWKMR